MSRADKLSNYPYVRVRVRCGPCRRYGDLSLAKLAVRYGADASLWDVMVSLTSDCPRRRGRAYGRMYHPCHAQLVDMVEDNHRGVDLPRDYRWQGAGAEEAKGRAK